MEYIITNIVSKNGDFNIYHEWMHWAEANILFAEVGERADIQYKVEGAKYPNHQASTSPVVSIEDDGETLTLETINTVYTFQRQNKGGVL